MENLDYEYIATLVEKAKKKDSDAFAELYAATYQSVYRFACQYLRDKALAEDALQETFILVFKNITTLREPMLFVSWLNQIAFRVCFRMQQQNNEFHGASTEKTPEDNTEVPAKAASPEEIAVSVDERSFLARQIMGLPSSESQVLIMHYYNNYPIPRIADIMNISQSSVKRYLASGREKLSRLVER